MEGADKLPNGYYGTCLGIDHAMDPTMDVILAFEQNGQRLIPDHGYPVRMLIPGWIGGRMVKWLTKIIVTEKESDNYYHYFDNRILPPQVTRNPKPKTRNSKPRGTTFRPRAEALSAEPSPLHPRSH